MLHLKIICTQLACQKEFEVIVKVRFICRKFSGNLWTLLDCHLFYAVAHLTFFILGFDLIILEFVRQMLKQRTKLHYLFNKKERYPFSL